MNHNKEAKSLTFLEGFRSQPRIELVSECLLASPRKQP